MALDRLPNELLNRIIEFCHHDRIADPVFTKNLFTRAAVPNVHSSQVDVKTSWLVSSPLSSVNRRLRTLSMERIALSMRLEQENDSDIVIEALRTSSFRSEVFSIPKFFRRHLGPQLRNIQIAKVSTDVTTFEHISALIKFSMGEISCLLKKATRLRLLILDGFPDNEIFVDRLCFLLASAKRTSHDGRLLVEILGSLWSKLSIDRVARATRACGNAVKTQDEARYKRFQSRMASAIN